MPTDRSVRKLLAQWGLLWSVIILASLLWNEHLSQHRINEFAHHEARNTILKDLTFRRWVTMHGGVYVRPTAQTPPNPWLTVPKRDIVTSDGDLLTLMNPAYVTRQVMAMYNETHGTKGHITSLHLKNPDNAPDDWERQALLAFASGAESASTTVTINGAPYYRLILPMKMEQGCLKCHADTGIPVGGIRGGISTAVPLAPHLAAASQSVRAIRLAHGGIWLLGMASITVGSILYDRQQRRREEAEERLQETALFLRESQAIARVGGWKSNPDTGVLRWTDELYQMLECPAEFRLTHESGFSVVHPDDRDRIDQALAESWKSGSGFSHTCRMTTATGRQFWCDVRCLGRVENHSGSYLVGTLQDITHYKQAEEMLITARDAAEASTRTKNELLAVISHELRTPLNGVIGGAQLLDMTELSCEQREYLRMIELSAGNELALVNDLLDLASLDAADIRTQEAPFVLRESITSAIVPHRTAIEERGLALTVELADGLGARVLGDSRRLTQVVSNLLGNAVKFTHQGEIVLHAATDDTGDGVVTLRVTVSDTGIGIDQKDRERIFEPFVQADMSHTRSYGGSGLGLSICNKLVQRMGGSITLESEAGKGSRFTITLPFRAAPLAEAPAPPAGDTTPTTGDGRTILIAEDNLINQKAVAEILKKHGYSVICAADGKEALAFWMKGGVDLILMDIQMPVMDGIEALQFIRQTEQHAATRTPVVALTAHAMRDDRERLLHAGFDGYLAKPVEMQRLLTELERITSDRSRAAV
ncbi:ATP-binding protein [Trichlorobacter ammonificans]|uniref:histidine kinase n=1 Tax=Trichlorobacter ammonificans TaxID=2916410 RepID=A0ABN8HEC0_9BACT|nr:ATP-binding protein [Trichlorobacter ammonificans]CAH2029896.1 putative Histidine kinase [Trichlorobacter ammonificans]